MNNQIIKNGKTNLAGNLGKLPPQATDLESAVLGGCILNSDVFLEVSDILRPEMFYRDHNSIIYAAICEMSIQGEPIDMISIISKLKKRGELEKIGGPIYITDLTDNVVNTANVEYNARIIAEKYMQRELINLSSQTISDCFDETSDVFDILDNYETKRDEIINQVVAQKEVSSSDAVNEVMSELVRMAELKDLDVTGVDTGFGQVNRNTGGWQDSNFLILAARPAMGKTAMMIKFVLSAARAGDAVIVFSLEMSKEQLVKRVLSIMSDVPLFHIMKPSRLEDHEWERLERAKEEFANLPITWDDSPDINILEISSKCKRLKRKKDIKFVVIDYLQLIAPIDKKVIREQQVSQISRSLKILSKTIRVPVLALSQLSRAVESRPGNSKRPMLSDLRESGSLEQDADMVMFLYRAEYYDIIEDEMGQSTIGRGEIIIAKNRSGQTDNVQVGWDAEKTRFYDLDQEPIYDFGFLNDGKVPELPSNDMSRFNTFGNGDDINIDDEVVKLNNFITPKKDNDIFDEPQDEFPF